ncbi:uracil-DNA glycosylase [Bordetella ansorpii]|uniref:Uracil-DNA glycosylase n=1 Tax=Bordetella ansorpii TaxID=288768 RepID=A0A157R031_9BORD|nr:uracil-DNA glycosylase [Bordetella ansorpii]SAI51174.1 uracil-DNA glycosylase [Bordetella ansorpii]
MPIDNRLVPHTLADHAAQLPGAWKRALASPEPAQALQAVIAYVEQRLADGATVYPARPLRALEDLAPHQVRVVILGQDPYHGPGQAQGLAFSVPDDCKTPPSLRNMRKEIARDEPGSAVSGNDLSGWLAQGVLLLNTSLTVEDGQAGAHAKRGWERVTDALIAAVAADPAPKVFMLWGAHAQAKRGLLPPEGGHLVLTSNHPSPLSATRGPEPFVGCGHFGKANAWLRDQGQAPIDWSTGRGGVQGEAQGNLLPG